MQPNWSCQSHYPLQISTTLSVADIFSTPLNLMFYQNTYIAAIFLKEHMVCLWDSQVVTSLPHFQLNSEDLHSTTHNFAPVYKSQINL